MNQRIEWRVDRRVVNRLVLGRKINIQKVQVRLSQLGLQSFLRCYFIRKPGKLLFRGVEKLVKGNDRGHQVLALHVEGGVSHGELEPGLELPVFLKFEKRDCFGAHGLNGGVLDEGGCAVEG